jgi:hypothetical protein
MNYRLRSWHSNIIEDTDGRTLCTAASAKEAFLILDALRGKNLAVAGSLEEAEAAFEAKPCAQTAHDFLFQLMEAEADGKLGNDEFFENLSAISQWLSKLVEDGKEP